VGHDSHNGGDDCANGFDPLGDGYWSFKTNDYEARTHRGVYHVGLEYHWPIDDPEYCSG